MTTWLNSQGIVGAQSVGLGTTGPITQTVDGSVLGAATQVEAINQALSQIEMQQLMMEAAMAWMQSHHQQTVPQAIQQQLSNILHDMALQSNQQSTTVSNTHLTGTNSSMNTKTKKAESAAYKPVTLTLTGQLKPSTITKAVRPKSRPSTGAYSNIQYNVAMGVQTGATAGAPTFVGW